MDMDAMWCPRHGGTKVSSWRDPSTRHCAIFSILLIEMAEKCGAQKEIERIHVRKQGIGPN